jgi:hypothetical protein
MKTIELVQLGRLRDDSSDDEASESSDAQSAEELSEVEQRWADYSSIYESYCESKRVPKMLQDHANQKRFSKSVAELCCLGVLSSPVSKAAEDLLRNGFVVLRGAVDPNALPALRTKMDAHMTACERALKGMGLTWQHWRKWQEVDCRDHRNFCHWDLQVPGLDPPSGAGWNSLMEELSACWTDWERNAGDDRKLSCGPSAGAFSVRRSAGLLARPGNMEQLVHRDTERDVDWYLGDAVCDYVPPYQLNVFLPLVEITESNGGTQFYPGTQFAWHPVFRDDAFKLTAKLGDAVVCDSRCIHHVTSNESDDERPVAYWSYMRSSDPWDDNNFTKPMPSLFKHEYPPEFVSEESEDCNFEDSGSECELKAKEEVSDLEAKRPRKLRRYGDEKNDIVSSMKQEEGPTRILHEVSEESRPRVRKALDSDAED